MLPRVKKPPPSQNLSTYQGAIKKHLTTKFGEDSEDPDSLSHVPDGHYTMTIRNDLLNVHMHNGRIVSIGRVEPKVFPTLPKPKRMR